MEEEERKSVESSKTGDLGGFADRIARDLIKETIIETNSVKIWSIPCSSGCHSHTKHKGMFSYLTHSQEILIVIPRRKIELELFRSRVF